MALDIKIKTNANLIQKRYARIQRRFRTIFEKGLFKELPGEVEGINTYSYWKHDNNTRITKQLVKKHK